jgi:mxaJ protein
MSSACKTILVLLLAGAPAISSAGDVLRVCADPNNLPFSNERRQGFENALASLLAEDLGLQAVEYVWWPQRRGFIRYTLNSGRCDVVMGVPADYELAQTTQPYYRSTYVFVTRQDRGLNIRSFDDPSLRRLRIGIHAIGDDYSSVPPAQALANRGIVTNLIGFSIYGDYSKENPPAALIRAVEEGEVDVAIAWGPLAGYFAREAAAPLKVTPVSPAFEPPALALAFDISMGVRKGDSELRDLLNSFIERRRRAIVQLLASYGVPLAAETNLGGATR